MLYVLTFRRNDELDYRTEVSASTSSCNLRLKQLVQDPTVTDVLYRAFDRLLRIK